MEQIEAKKTSRIIATLTLCVPGQVHIMDQVEFTIRTIARMTHEESIEHLAAMRAANPGIALHSLRE